MRLAGCKGSLACVYSCISTWHRCIFANLGLNLCSDSYDCPKPHPGLPIVITRYEEWALALCVYVFKTPVIQTSSIMHYGCGTAGVDAGPIGGVAAHRLELPGLLPAHDRPSGDPGVAGEHVHVRRAVEVVVSSSL